MRPLSPFMKKQPDPRAVGYVRGSTEEQQHTLEAQETQIRRYCEAHGLTLTQIFIDSGVSGSSEFSERPAAGAMLAFMEEVGCQQIVFTKLDRAFRSVRNCVLTVDDWTRRGVVFHIIEMNIDTSKAMGRAFLQIMAVLAELENGQRSERQRHVFAQMKSTGQRCGTVPYGWDAVRSLRLSKTTRQADDLVPNEEEQRVLRQIADWIEQENECVSAIARYLNDAGTPTKTGQGKWYPATVQSVYNHRRLAPDDPGSGSIGGPPVGSPEQALEDAA